MVRIDIFFNSLLDIGFCNGFDPLGKFGKIVLRKVVGEDSTQKPYLTGRRFQHQLEFPQFTVPHRLNQPIFDSARFQFIDLLHHSLLYSLIRVVFTLIRVVVRYRLNDKAPLVSSRVEACTGKLYFTVESYLVK
ncbi:hypothetical protein SDC9_197372 [bioreactor metagenome]|uniref:Uncharacterized protein n=1 Tax=bioreactor metagenome TaxID=1076179 RepID=A0A645IF62_9ZZZZ